MPYYLNPVVNGLLEIAPIDGYSLSLRFATAYPTIKLNKIIYYIYFSSDIAPDFTSKFFDIPPAFVSIDGSTIATIVDLIPGDLYHASVRAFEYDTTKFDPTILPIVNGLSTLPQSLLAADISATANQIPLISVDNFPASGTVKIGTELVYYASIDTTNSILNIPSSNPTPAELVDQGGGNFYVPSSSNTGIGTINNLQLVNSNAPTEIWTIKCVEVLRDSSNNIISNTARFSAIGSVSGSHIDGQDYFWIADNVVVSNNILSFSIEETSVFKEGDYFTVKIAGAAPAIGNGRGYNNTTAQAHSADTDAAVYWPNGILDQNTKVFSCQNRFDIHNYQFTLVDGYHQKTTDILTTDLTYSDTVNTGFPAYDFAGYHRTDPVLILNGTCIGSYIGGYQFCADGYSGVGLQVRGISAQDANLQRQEVLLSTTGEPVCLIKRRWTGITCKCYLPSNEYPSARCVKCFGGGIVISYEQVFDSRRSDGKIMVRFDPSVDDLKAMESGLESDMKPNCWTLGSISLKNRDFIVRFNEDAVEEFRYEILNVTRNKLFLDMTGAQKFALQRIRKTDIIQQVPVFHDTSMFPIISSTSIDSSLGIIPHFHTYTMNETPSQNWSQITGTSQGHSHYLYVDSNTNTLKVSTELGHSHSLIF